MAGLLRLLWTKQAAAYGVIGALTCLGGALAGLPGVALLGGTLLVWIAVDALLAGTGHPHVKMDVQPLRVAEGREASVAVDASHVRRHHQFLVPLGRGLRVADDASNVWTPAAAGSFHMDLGVVAEVRGPQAVGPVHVRRWSPSRLWISDVIVTEEVAMDVVPRMEDLSEVRIVSKTLRPQTGRFPYNQPGEGMEFFALREYQSGDSIRAVNWKASARSEGLIVNQRQRETESEIVIMLDARLVAGTGPAGHSPLDRSCRAALAVYADAAASKDIVRFIAYGDGVVRMPRDTPGGKVHTFEDILARLPAQGMTSSGDAWHEIRRDIKLHGPAFIFTSAEGDPTLPGVVGNLIGRSHPVTVISPQPAGPAWDEDEARQRRREKALKAMQDLGAEVVDWSMDDNLRAEAPEATRVL